MSPASTVATRDPPRITSTVLQAWMASSRRCVEISTQAPARARVGDDLEGRLDADRVDAVERLVEQQHLGLVQGRQHHGEAAAHAVREAGGDAVGDVAELEALEQVASPLLPVVEAPQPGRELEVLPGGGARHQAADVGAVADQPLHLEGVATDVEPGHPDLAGGRRHHAGEHAHGRRLAGAVAAQQGGRLAGVALEVDTGDGLHLAEADVEAHHVDDGRTVRGSHARILPESAVAVA